MRERRWAATIGRVMKVQRLAVVDDVTGERLWELYDRAFAPLAVKTALRQTLDHEEFIGQLRDMRVWKFVGRHAETGEAIGLATISRHLETDHTLSIPYFAARWPREYVEGRLYYFGFVVVDPEWQGEGRYHDILRPLVEMLRRNRAVAAFDVSRHNEHELGLVANLIEGQGLGQLEEIDTQAFYAVTFGPDGTTTPVVDLTETGAGRPNR